ncbi:hypothetical protein D9758_004185 [Tetrapyrgos nigripes]|uniref:F-box domain-containing protein n=1 Tax=Tetrapyrgos nigripes TaxID=182062 RepID=A0A8H5LVR6_9AGAR|nr:hypothetical protein D9758_004185 [Tetrapyrgos nigripes]
MTSSVNITLCRRCGTGISFLERQSDPEIKRKIRTMYTPSSSETAHISALVQDCQRDLDRYDAEISSLRQTLARLEKERDKLECFTHEKRALVSAARRLPTEILLEIFTLCCFQNGLSITFNGVNAIMLKISHVCSHWRQVAFSFPELWACMDVELACTSDSVGRLVNRYLERSQGADLTLKISVREDGDDDDENSWPQQMSSSRWDVLSSLLSHCMQWYDVSIQMHWKLMGSIWDHTNDDYDFDSLRHLKIQWFPFSHNKEWNSFIILFSFAPLRTLTLNHFFDEMFWPFDRGIPFEYVKIVVLRDSVFQSDMVKLFVQCPNMEALEIICAYDEWYGTWDAEREQDYPQINCHSLQSLSMKIEPCLRGLQLFSALSLPNLTKLRLEGYLYTVGQPGFDPIVWQQNLVDMLRQSPSLNHLTLYHRPFKADDDIIQILSATPNLTHLGLDIHLSLVTDNLLSRLSLSHLLSGDSHSPRRVNMLSKLTHLEIKFQEDDFLFTWEQRESLYPDPATALSMVKSRRLDVPRGYSVLEHFEFVGRAAQTGHQQWASMIDPTNAEFQALRRVD